MTNQSLDAIKLANKYLTDKKLAHSLRVASYACEELKLFNSQDILREDVFTVALLHDVVEDTECDFTNLEISGISEELVETLEILTNSKTEEYSTYIQRIVNSKNPIALIVKRADIKDHLLQEETLTDKLKDKYYPNIKYIL